MRNWASALGFDQLEAQHGLPPGLLNAVMQTESAGDPKAVSRAGAQGLFQFMPATADEYGIDPFDPAQAASGAARKLADLQARFGGSLPHMLAAYNWGQGNVARQGLEAMPAETQGYVQKVSAMLGAQPSAPAGIVLDALPPTNEAAQVAGLPAGFVLEPAAGVAPVAPPPGFVLEQAAEAPPAGFVPETTADQKAAFAAAQDQKIAAGQAAADKLVNEVNFSQDFGRRAGATVLNSLQGLPFVGTFTDEIAAGLGALVGAGNGENFDQRYQNLFDQQASERALGFKYAPVATIVGGASTAIPGAIGAAGALSQLGGRLAAASPTAANLLQVAEKTAQARPLVASALGAGALGALQGYGAGAGDNRADSAALGGVLGSVLGPAVQVAAQPAARLLEGSARAGKSALDKLAGMFGKTPAAAASPGAGTTAGSTGPSGFGGISGQPLDDVADPATLAKLANEQGNVLKLPLGTKNNDVAALRAQAQARQGLLGAELEATQRAIDNNVTQQAKNVVQGLVGRETTDNADDLLAAGIENFKRRAAALDTRAGKLMNVRNEAIAQAGIYRQYAEKTLLPKVNEALDDPQLSVFMQTKDALPLRERVQVLQKMLGRGAGGRIQKPLDFAKLQGWSAEMSALGRANQGTSMGMAANRVVGQYNDWLENITKDAVLSGDDQLVNKILVANRNYADFKKMFGTQGRIGQSPVIEKIVKGTELTPVQLVNAVFGSSVKGKTDTSQTLGRMLSAMGRGAKRQELLDNFRAGLLLRAYRNSLSPAGEPRLGQLANNLDELTRTEMWNRHLKNPEFDAVITGLKQDLSRYVRTLSDPTITSTSGTAGALSRFMRSAFGSPLVRRVMPLASQVADEFASSLEQAPARELVKKAAQEFEQKLEPALEASKRFYLGPPVTAGTASGATAAPSEKNGGTATGNSNNVPVITIRPAEK